MASPPNRRGPKPKPTPRIFLLEVARLTLGPPRRPRRTAARIVARSSAVGEWAYLVHLGGDFEARVRRLDRDCRAIESELHAELAAAQTPTSGIANTTERLAGKDEASRRAHTAAIQAHRDALYAAETAAWRAREAMEEAEAAAVDARKAMKEAKELARKASEAMKAATVLAETALGLAPPDTAGLSGKPRRKIHSPV